MANALYPKWKEALLQLTANNGLNGSVKAALVTGAYTYSASHQFYSSVSGVAATPQTLNSKSFTNGVFSAANISFPAVAAGSVVTGIVIFIDTAVAATSPLVAFFDTGVNGLPVSTNGGDINVNWNASGIFAL